MKNRKWLTYTLGILLTLVVLAAVGGAGFRIGMMQNASFTRPPFAHNFDRAPLPMQGDNQGNGRNQPAQGNFPDNDNPQTRQGNPHNQGFGNRGNNRVDDRHSGMPIFSIIFGLIHLVVAGLLIWVVYKLAKNSGWKLIRVEAPAAPVQTASAEEVGKKKTSK